LVVDRLVVSRASEDKSRIADSVEQALKLGSGQVDHQPASTRWPRGQTACYSEQFAWPVRRHVAAGPRAGAAFSFNTPHGACPTCTGLGTKLEVDPDLVLANKELSLAQGAIAAWG